jgi:hypothetical protein
VSHVKVSSGQLELFAAISVFTWYNIISASLLSLPRGQHVSVAVIFVLSVIPRSSKSTVSGKSSRALSTTGEAANLGRVSQLLEVILAARSMSVLGCRCPSFKQTSLLTCNLDYQGSCPTGSTQLPLSNLGGGDGAGQMKYFVKDDQMNMFRIRTISSIHTYPALY